MEGLKKLGDPNEFARRYDEQEIDEIIYLDAVASLYGRNSLRDMVSDATRDVFTPLTVGGGIRSVDDALSLFRSGADKVAVNTAIHERPDLINELSSKFGAQSVVAQIDAKKDGDRWRCWYDGGRQPSERYADDWARECVDRGAGEILLTSIDREGTATGLDTDLIESIQVPVPVIASGGVGSAEDVLRGFEKTDAVAMAHVLHYEILTLADLRNYLKQNGVPVR